MTRDQRQSVMEIAGAMAIVAVALWLVDRAVPLLPVLGGFAGLLSALTFGLVPALVLRWGARRGLPPLADPLGIDRAPVGRGFAQGLLVSLIVLPLFALALDTLQVRVLRHRRLGPEALQSAGIAFQGRSADLTGRVALLDDRQGLAVENHTARPVQLRPACQQQPTCQPRTIPPGGRALLPSVVANDVAVRDSTGAPLPAGTVVAAGTGEPQDDPVRAPPGLIWLLLWLFTQLLVVALPEEMFFRGYILGRLRASFPPRQRLLGTPFGFAHVLSAGLFAVIHLVLVPSPARLLVFFPGLLFAWLAERSRGVFAPAMHHALANVCQTALLLLYAPR